MTIIDPRECQTIVCIENKPINKAGGSFLSISGAEWQWNNPDQPLVIQHSSRNPPPPPDNMASPQVWSIIKFRHNSWILLSQYSGIPVTIQGGGDNTGATIVQYTWFPNDQSRLWIFEPVPGTPSNGIGAQFYIKNLKSKKYIGINPTNIGTDNDPVHVCFQVDNPNEFDGRWSFDTELPVD